MLWIATLCNGDCLIIGPQIQHTWFSSPKNILDKNSTNLSPLPLTSKLAGRIWDLNTPNIPHICNLHHPRHQCKFFQVSPTNFQINWTIFPNLQQNFRMASNFLIFPKISEFWPKKDTNFVLSCYLSVKILNIFVVFFLLSNIHFHFDHFTFSH